GPSRMWKRVLLPLMGEERAYALAIEPGSEAQPAQDARRIRAHVDAAADLGEFGRLLVDIDFEARLPQRQCRGEPTDAAADHRDPEGCAAHRDLTQLRRRCQPLKKGLSRGGSAYFGAADEVDKAVGDVSRRSLAQALCPDIERIGRIAVGLVIGASPQMDVDEIGCDLEVGAAVVNEERHLMVAEQLDDRSGRHTRTAKLDGMAERAAVYVIRQQFKERGERTFVDRYVCGELPQDRP